jgi:monoglucosyldiacylglycerol epimerase
MDFKLLSGQIFIQLLLGLLCVLLSEVVRDLYHLAGHYWKPLQSFHNLHHKAYRRDLSITSLEMYKKAQWYNDVPESCVMVGATALAAGIAHSYGMWLGFIYSLGFLIPAIARSQGLLLQTDLTHKPGDLVDSESYLSLAASFRSGKCLLLRWLYSGG